MRSLWLLFFVETLVFADTAIPPPQSRNDGPERWAEACRRHLLAARDTWNPSHDQLRLAVRRMVFPTTG